MALNLGVIFTARDLASQQVNSLKNSFNDLDASVQASQANFQKHVAAFGAGLATMAAGGKILQSSVGLVSAAGEFTSSIGKMTSVTGFAGAELKALSDEALRLGTVTQFSPTQVIEGIKVLGTTGRDARDSLEVLDDVMRFAGASQGALNVEQAGLTFQAAMNAFAFGTERAEKTVDQLTKATQISSLQFQDIEQVIATTGDTVLNAGTSFETFLATVGALKGQGGTAIGSAEKLRIALSKIGSVSRIGQQALDALGLKITDLRDKATGKILNLPDLFDKLNNRIIAQSKGLTKAEAEAAKTRTLSLLLGVEGVKAFNKVQTSQVKVTKDNQFAIDQLSKQLGRQLTIVKTAKGEFVKGTDAIRVNTLVLENSKGTAEKANEAYKKTFEGMIELLKGVAETIKITLGLPLLKNVLSGLGALNEQILSPFLQRIQQIPILAKAIIFALTGVGAALTFGGALVAALSGFALLKTAFVVVFGAGATLSSLLGSLGASIASGFAPVTGFIVLATVLFQIFRANFDTFVVLIKDIGGFFNELKTGASGLFDSFMKGLQDSTGGLDGLRQTFQPVITVIIELVKEVGSEFKNLLVTLGILDSTSAFSNLNSGANTLGQIFGLFVIPAIKTVFDIIGILTGAIVGLVKAINEIVIAVQVAVSFYGQIFNSIVTKASEFTTNLKTTIMEGLDILKNDLVERALVFGISWMTAMAEGIGKAGGILYDAIKNQLGFVRDLLPGSDAKTGPLSDLTKSGAGLFMALSDGINSVKDLPGKLVNKSLEPLANTLTNQLSKFAGNTGKTIVENSEPINQTVNPAIQPVKQTPIPEKPINVNISNPNTGTSGNNNEIVSEKKSEPIVIQLVLNQRILAETLVDLSTDQLIRSFS